jgi:hypothetical protein
MPNLEAFKLPHSTSLLPPPSLQKRDGAIPFIQYQPLHHDVGTNKLHQHPLALPRSLALKTQSPYFISTMTRAAPVSRGFLTTSTSNAVAFHEFPSCASRISCPGSLLFILYHFGVHGWLSTGIALPPQIHRRPHPLSLTKRHQSRLRSSSQNRCLTTQIQYFMRNKKTSLQNLVELGYLRMGRNKSLWSYPMNLTYCGYPPTLVLLQSLPVIFYLLQTQKSTPFDLHPLLSYSSTFLLCLVSTSSCGCQELTEGTNISELRKLRQSVPCCKMWEKWGNGFRRRRRCNTIRSRLQMRVSLFYLRHGASAGLQPPTASRKAKSASSADGAWEYLTG